VHRVRPSSVSTAPSLCHAQPRIGVTAEAAELGRCGAEHGAGGHCVGAALASHARSHAPAAGSAPRSRSRRCDSPHDPDSTSYREGRATSEAASASVERRSWSSVGFEYEILCSTPGQRPSPPRPLTNRPPRAADRQQSVLKADPASGTAVSPASMASSPGRPGRIGPRPAAQYGKVDRSPTGELTSSLSEIDGRALCYPASAQVAPIHRCHKGWVNRRSSAPAA
jgi:hypothetical protein